MNSSDIETLFLIVVNVVLFGFALWMQVSNWKLKQKAKALKEKDSD